MEKERIPDSIKHPLAIDADWAAPGLWGGAAAVVGFLGLVAGVVVGLLGSAVSGSILLALGAALFLAGFYVFRRGQ